VLEVFRFAWFAVRTFFGVIAFVLALEAALWAFVKIHSTLMSNADTDTALKRCHDIQRAGNRTSGSRGGGGGFTRSWDRLPRVSSGLGRYRALGSATIGNKR